MKMSNNLSLRLLYALKFVVLHLELYTIVINISSSLKLLNFSYNLIIISELNYSSQYFSFEKKIILVEF